MARVTDTLGEIIFYLQFHSLLVTLLIDVTLLVNSVLPYRTDGLHRFCPLIILIIIAILLERLVTKIKYLIEFLKLAFKKDITMIIK